MQHLIPVLGLFVMLAIAWALSSNRGAIKWRPVAMGTALQIVFALIILKAEVGRNVFDVVGAGITRFLDFTDAGASFVFDSGLTMYRTDLPPGSGGDPSSGGSDAHPHRVVWRPRATC